MLNNSKIIDDFIADKKADNTLINLVKSLDNEGKKVLERLINELSPSANALKNILTLAEEISFRDKKNITDVIKDQNISEIISDEKKGRKDKIKKIKDYLDEVRFPLKSKIEKEVDELKKKLKSEYNLKIEVPEDLEGDQLSVTILGRSPEDLKIGSDRLEKLSKSSDLNSLFSILKGEL